MAVQRDLCDELLAEFARLLVILTVMRVQSIVFSIRFQSPVAHSVVILGDRVVAFVSEQIVASLIDEVKGVFGVGHGAFGIGQLRWQVLCSGDSQYESEKWLLDRFEECCR